jgi:3-hydroxybutyryl-CoA dehydrogenase
MASDRTESGVHRIAVIGAGTMGSQIAARSALAGKEVAIFDSLDGAVDRCFERQRDDILPSLVATRAFPEASSDDAMARIRQASSMVDALAGAELVIEAVLEEIEVKRAVFRELSAATDAILATNSSSLPSSLLVEATSNPARLLNMHFFAPIWVRTMLEVMSCGQTSPEAFETAMAFGQDLKLTIAAVRVESKGFIINRIWRAIKRESLRVVDEGVADPEDVDKLFMLFFQTDYPPFGIMDMSGLDVVEDIESSYQAVSVDPSDLPSKTLRSLVESGNLGEKTGSGFYQHPNPAYQQDDFLKN